MDKGIELYRKRYIPNETNHLKDDNIIYMEDNLIVTSWKALKPRKDINNGISAYFIDEGYKVSKLYDANGEIVYWYCDLIKTKKSEDGKSFVFEDLLLDVVVYESGKVVVLDADELADVIEKKIITDAEACMALRNMNKLLKIIYSGKFDEIKNTINKYEK